MSDKKVMVMVYNLLDPHEKSFSCGLNGEMFKGLLGEEIEMPEKFIAVLNDAVEDKAEITQPETGEVIHPRKITPRFKVVVIGDVAEQEEVKKK